MRGTQAGLREMRTHTREMCVRRLVRNTRALYGDERVGSAETRVLGRMAGLDCMYNSFDFITEEGKTLKVSCV